MRSFPAFVPLEGRLVAVIGSGPAAEAKEGRNPDLDSLPSLFTALEQQVGLKLEARKGPVETYVIERVEGLVEN